MRDAEPRTLQVMNTIDELDSYSPEGVLEFMLQGQRLRLRPFTPRPKRFYVVFRDASAGAETYQVAEAYNPPCAIDKYTTCPLPLKENILPVKILAGERAYGK